MNTVLRRLRVLGMVITAAVLAGSAAAGADKPALVDDVVFRNPSFEEDFENDGIPDRWEIPETTAVTLVTEATHGAKAACFSTGYVLAAQNFSLRNLAGRDLLIRLDAKGAGGAAFGCLVGYFIEGPKQPLRFIYSRPAWDKPLSEHYERLTLRCTFSPHARDGRVWIAFYRSNRRGTVWLDHVEATAQKSTPEERLARVRLTREYGYLENRARRAVKRFPASAPRLEALTAEAAGRKDALARPEDPAKEHRFIAAGHARINALTGGAGIQIRWAPACERLDPAAPPDPGPGPTPAPVALRGEALAFGIDLLNPFDRAVPLTLRVLAGSGFEAAVALRRQVFMETWYKKAKTRIADPLPLLAETADGAWKLTLEPGGRERLYLQLTTRADAAARQPLRITAETGTGDPRRLACEVNVLPVDFPRAPRFAHVQFLYPDLEPARSHPDAVARDLAAHGVSGIEFPYLPKVAFAPDGTLAKADFAASNQARWMKIYGRHIPTLMLFWEGNYKRFPIVGEKDRFLEYIDADGHLTPAFRRAYVALLKAWLAFARDQGFGTDRFLMLPDDEPSSKKEFAHAPGSEVRRSLELYRLTRAAAPDLAIAVTLSDYATPPDVAVIAPAVDVIFPLCPYREKLPRWVPPGYRPREVFRRTIFPMLEKERQKRGLKIWSYRVDAGKSEPVLISARAYPLIALGAGFTGVATWAYNVKRGKSWDDTDGGLLDYVFIYDGSEDHPLNHRVNPRGEIVVPSIRWEALRLGWQDAQIAYCLRERARRSGNTELERKLDALLRPPAAWAGAPEKATFAAVRRIGQDIRRLFAAAATR